MAHSGGAARLAPATSVAKRPRTQNIPPPVIGGFGAASAPVAQQTVTRTGEAVTLEAGGRHDPCVLPRAVPMVEAMVCLTLADHWLRQRAVDVVPRD